MDGLRRGRQRSDRLRRARRPPLRPYRCRRADRLKLRQASRRDGTGRAVGYRQAVALQAAIDRRILDWRFVAYRWWRVDSPAVERIWIEADCLKKRRRHCGADRTHIMECCCFDGAEGRLNQMLVPVLGNAGLLRYEAGEILISDRRRQQRAEECAEPKARGVIASDRPTTRRHHLPSPQTHTQRYADAVNQTPPQWRHCDTRIYCRVNVAKALIG